MKLIIVLLIICTVAFTACNQQEHKNPPPQQIESAFVKLHPNATVFEWKDEPPNWEAKYNEGSEKGAVSYNKEAEVVETELVIKESQLPNPPVIPEYIRANYPGERLQSCEKVTKQDGPIEYEIQITGKEIVFESQGKYINEEPD